MRPAPSRHATLAARTAILIAGLALGSSPAIHAQTWTLDFSGLGLPNYGDIPQSYGDVAGKVDVSNRSRSGFGNTLQTCGNVELWDNGYSSLQHVAFACGNGQVGEFSFTALGGNTVYLQSLQLGSYESNSSGVGPLRAYSVRIYDSSWTPLYTSTGSVTSTLTLTPNVSSSTGLYLQWGTDWNVGVDNITYSAMPASTVPEPMSMALLGTGLAGLGALRRRRRTLG